MYSAWGLGSWRSRPCLHDHILHSLILTTPPTLHTTLHTLTTLRTKLVPYPHFLSTAYPTHTSLSYSHFKTLPTLKTTPHVISTHIPFLHSNLHALWSIHTLVIMIGDRLRSLNQHFSPYPYLIQTLYFMHTSHYGIDTTRIPRLRTREDCKHRNTEEAWMTREKGTEKLDSNNEERKEGKVEE